MYFLPGERSLSRDHRATKGKVRSHFWIGQFACLLVSFGIVLLYVWTCDGDEEVVCLRNVTLKFSFMKY